jgi:hypothetical protein
MAQAEEFSIGDGSQPREDTGKSAGATQDQE